MAGAYSVTPFRHSVLPSFRYSVSAHYLCNTGTFSNEIWYIGLSWEYAGQVRIWVRSNNFRQSYAPWTLKKSNNVQFPLIISNTNWHFELKFGIWMCHENKQVKFKFGSGRIIFGRVMPLELGNFKKFTVSAHYLSHTLIFWIEIWYIDISWEYAGQVRIRVGTDKF